MNAVKLYKDLPFYWLYGQTNEPFSVILNAR